MLWLIRWGWRRISDWYTGLDILEAFGWKSVGAAMLAGGMAGIGTFLHDAPGHTVFLASIGAALIVLGVVIAWQTAWSNRNYRKSLASSETVTSPLKIEFDPSSCSRWENRQHPALPQQVSTRVYFFNIYNSHQRKDVDNVTAEVERVEVLPKNSDDIVDTQSGYLGYKLRFQRNGQQLMRFSPDLRDRVDLASFGLGIMTYSSFNIEGEIDRPVFHQDRRQRVHVKVTGDGVPSVRATFTAWVEYPGSFYVTKD